jgi:predicted transcriptional regulator
MHDPDPALVATTPIVSVWLDTHDVAATAIPNLIRDVHQSLTTPASDREPDRPRPAARKERAAGDPVVDVRKSVFPDHIVCLEDGKPFKMLSRHLKDAHDVTPAQYRTKWGLPDTYPMVAPDYSALRSGMAKGTSLGKRR